MSDFSDVQDLLRSILNDEELPEAPSTESVPAPKPEPIPVASLDAIADKEDDTADASIFDIGKDMFDLPTIEDVTAPKVEEVAEEEIVEVPTPVITAPVAVEEEINLDDILSKVDETNEPTAKEMIFKAEPAKAVSDMPMPTFTSEELAEEMDIRNFATLVTLNTARWHGKVKDRTASKYAAETAGADADAFDTQKRLLHGADEKLRKVHKAIDDARTQHYQMTLPWSTTGAGDSGKRMGGRLLPHTMFMEYTKAMAHGKVAMTDAVDEFEKDYQSAITKAQQNLGSRFDPAEYPNPASIRQHFDLSFDFHPIPIGDDFMGLADQQIAKLSHTLQKRNRVMLENAMQETWKRCYELVEQAADRFGTPDALFHYTLIEKLKDASYSLKNLNVTGDPCIEKVRATIAKHLTMHDAAAIRGDDALRARLGQIAKACLKEMQTYNK